MYHEYLICFYAMCVYKDNQEILPLYFINHFKLQNYILYV